jgi:integrase
MKKKLDLSNFEKVDERTAGVLLNEDVKRVLNYFLIDIPKKNDDITLFVAFGFYTGLRFYDIQHLRYGHIFESNGHIREYLQIREHKTNKLAKLRISPQLSIFINMILVPRVRYKEGDDFIFHSKTVRNKTEDKLVAHEWLYPYLKKAKKDLNLKIRFSAHTFRKSFGRYVYESNGRNSDSLILLMKMFHHSSPEVTLIYIGLEQDRFDDVYTNIKY